MYLGEINKSHFANICFHWTGIFMRYTELCNSQNEKEMLEHIILQMEEESGLDRAAAIASMRFDFIQKVCGGRQ